MVRTNKQKIVVRRYKEPEPEIPYYMYIVVRKDLSPEQQCVQSVHAAIESSKVHLRKGITPHVILYEIENEDKLITELIMLRAHKIKCIQFREPDKNNEITAFATQVFKGPSQLLRDNKKLKLLRFGIKDVTVNRFKYKY